MATGRITTLTSRTGPDSGPVPSPDGGMIAYTGMDHTTDTYREEGLYVMDADGGNPRVIATEMGRRPGDRRLGGRRERRLFQRPAPGDEQPLPGAARRRGPPGQLRQPHALGVHGERRRHRGGRGQCVPHPRKPGRLLGGFAGRDVHPARDERVVLAEVTLGEVEEIWYKSPDGLDIQGWIVKPPDFDPSRKYPLILRIHGGPHAMYNSGFDFKNQDHAANGYVLLYTNPRGSSGYGSSFGNEIKNAYPGKDLDDLLAGVDEVIARGYIDERNLFVYGGSGGGVLTSWIVGNTDRFTAAVSKAPVTNWFSFVGTTDGASWYRNFEKLPWDDPEEHLRRSTLMYVGNVTTPTMLMTGEKDLRTPMEQTEQYYKALKMRKIPTAMVRLTDSWHSRSRPPTNFMRVQLLLRNWFERFAVTDEMTTDAQPN